MTATLAAPPSAPATAQRPLIEELILARLLVADTRPPTPAKLREAINRLTDGALTAEQVADITQRLRAEGLLTAKGLALTDAGRAAALGFLNLQKLPPRCDWRRLQANYLVPMALRLDPADTATAKKIDNEDHLGALLLRRREKLPTGTKNTANAAVEALACRDLGFPEETSLKSVLEIVVGRRLGDGMRLPREKLKTQLPRVLFNAPRGGVQGLREAVLREWVNGGKPATPPPAAAEMDLAEFARTVRAVAHDCSTGRFGDNKVFISHVWRQFRAEPTLPPYDLDAFKARLVEANRHNLLTLSRADLVSVMNPDDVRASETAYLNAQYHFILVEKERP